MEDAGTQKRTQATQASGSRRGAATQSLDDDDDAPLLPRSRGKRKLLSQIQEEDDDDEVLSLPAASRRRGATPATQDLLPTRGRSTRGGSAVSETSSVSATAAAASKPTQRTRRAPARSARATEVLDDSDSDGVVFATARSSTRRGTAVQPSATLDFDEEPPRSTRATAASGSTRTSTRRKLLVDDDDDDTVSPTHRAEADNRHSRASRRRGEWHSRKEHQGQSLSIQYSSMATALCSSYPPASSTDACDFFWEHPSPLMKSVALCLAYCHIGVFGSRQLHVPRQP